MTQILHSAPTKKKVTKILKSECKSLVEKNIIPYLKVVLVGKDPASLIYTSNKKKFCEKIGAKCDIVELSENISEKNFLDAIYGINHDDSVHGCIIQLPLPKHLSHLDVGKLIVRHKDVDGFHPENLYSVMSNKISEHTYVSCTPKGIITLIKDNNIDVTGKNVVIIGRSMIVGKPLSMLFTNMDATVTLCHSKSINLKNISKSADILICAIGKAKFINIDFISPNKNQIIIDVGMNTDTEGQLCGDVDYHSVFNHVQMITPVPGGVGPMTIVSLAQNLLQASKNRLSI